jgi:2-polyprenyl-3-methyl-5-hydroxy-6-metoxy-1,4-benzoquinol methylase
MHSVPLAREGEAPDIETASAEYAARFDGPAGRYLLSVQESAVRTLLAPYAGQTLLEIGGGHGQLLRVYAALDLQVTLHGSKPVCFERLSGPEFKRVTPLVGPYLGLGLPDRSFDVVVAIRLVMHEQEWQRLLAEMCRLARKAVIIDYASTRSLNAVAPLLFKVKKRLEGNTRNYLSFSRDQLAKVLDGSGFNMLREERQLFLPTVVHRKLGDTGALRGTENLCRAVGLTRALGSPVILRAQKFAAGDGSGIPPGTVSA